MTIILKLVFYLFTAVILGSGLVVAFSQNLLRSAFALFFVLFGVAGLYLLLGADFLAVAQVMVYAGGINVLLIFGTMLTSDISRPKTSSPSFQKVLAGVGGTVLFCFLFWAINSVSWPVDPDPRMEPSAKALGKLLLRDYVLPFEVVSFLLLTAMIGALVIIKNRD